MRGSADTIGPAGRFTRVLLNILADADQAGLRPIDIPPLGDATRADIEQLRARIDVDINVDIDADWLAAGLMAWTSLIGLISFIRFGHLHNVVLEEDVYFADTLDRLGRSLIAV